MIYVCSLSRLTETVEKAGARHVVTLINQDTPVPLPGSVEPANYLRIDINDITAPEPGATHCGPHHVANLIAFGQRWPREAPLVVHCFAGISRSSAAAYVLACALMPERDEAEIAEALRQASPTATPNALIVKHGDDALARNTRMITAVSRIGRGTHAAEGEPFMIPLA